MVRQLHKVPEVGSTSKMLEPEPIADSPIINSGEDSNELKAEIQFLQQSLLDLYIHIIIFIFSSSCLDIKADQKLLGAVNLKPQSSLMYILVINVK